MPRANGLAAAARSRLTWHAPYAACAGIGGKQLGMNIHAARPGCFARMIRRCGRCRLPAGWFPDEAAASAAALRAGLAAETIPGVAARVGRSAARTQCAAAIRERRGRPRTQPQLCSICSSGMRRGSVQSVFRLPGCQSSVPPRPWASTYRTFAATRRSLVS